ncbi:hypothetical protein EW145_g923 [Phellinidium pouzarii]|uniref:Methyltransferase domain-containing protein n=1 Tax=Phellinidium pouzarii TaxID=167371 RepID=A0A4V3XDT5_9AGAM|nr:hypothetical protein EW145_g923 [Phellinidium pouzarii]
MTTAQITRELDNQPLPLEPLDPSLFRPSPTEWAFLREAISVDEEEVRKRVLVAQNETYTRYPYPCIRWFHFTNLFMSTNPIYPTVLAAAKASGDTLFLDLGCCMGTDVRKLVKDGYPPERVAGCDLRRAFIDACYTLFNDSPSTCAITFLTSDIFEINLDPSPPHPSTRPFNEATSLDDLRGRLSHVYSGALFHLFNEETQSALAARLARLLRVPPGRAIGDAPAAGGIIFGRHQGKETPGLIDDAMGRYEKAFIFCPFFF